MNLSTIAGILLISATFCNAEELPGEPFDYNFDGHMDYRVLTVSDAKSSQFDVFIYDPELTGDLLPLAGDGPVIDDAAAIETSKSTCHPYEQEIKDYKPHHLLPRRYRERNCHRSRGD